MAPLVAAVAAVAVSSCGEQRGAADAERYLAELRPLNDSGVRGRATLDREGEHLTVAIGAEGLAPERIHPQGLHGFVQEGRSAQCPDLGSGEGPGPSADRDASAYGPRLYALEPFPTVGSDGSLAYRLTFTVRPDRLEPLASRALVLRGGEGRGSRYRPDLPVACGRLVSLANGVRASAR